MEESTNKLKLELEDKQMKVKTDVIRADYDGRKPGPNDNFMYWSGYDAALNFALGKLK